VKATGGVWNRESIEEKLGTPISDHEYHTFVEPFEGISRLEEIRASLKPNEIIEPTKSQEFEPQIIDFPESLPYSKEEIASFEAVHKLLATIKCSSFGQRDTDTFAQHHRLENQKAHILRFLWIFGCYGEFEKEDSKYLVVDAKTYGANRGSEKTLSIWTFVRDNVFKVLSEFGVYCERVALNGVKEEELTTGTGYLRNKGWVMRMSFDREIGGTDALKAIQTYTRRLDTQYSKKAFNRFTEADMRILAN
jgi:hypothetical protein